MIDGELAIGQWQSVLMVRLFPFFVLDYIIFYDASKLTLHEHTRACKLTRWSSMGLGIAL